MSQASVSSLFRHIEMLQADTPWGRFLDAGAGVNSALWGLNLHTEAWVGVTASAAHAAQIRDSLGAALRPNDRLMVSNWTDPALLRGEVFDTVLADYLLGAIEGFSPYFQGRLFHRLAPHVGTRLYMVGLDPYVVGEASGAAGLMVRSIGRFRDACLLLAEETPYREYPAEWVVEQLGQAGFIIESARRFPNRYLEKWVDGQIDMGLRRVAKIPDGALAGGLRRRGERLRQDALALCRQEGGLRHGADYVISARPSQDAQTRSPLASTPNGRVRRRRTGA